MRDLQEARDRCTRRSPGRRPRSCPLSRQDRMPRLRPRSPLRELQQPPPSGSRRSEDPAGGHRVPRRSSRRSKPSIEDLPVTELLRRLRHDGPDPRLMPRQGRRDRFFMMMLEAPAAAATVAEAGWMLDNDPEGYREAMRRADEFYGGPGALNAHLATILPQAPDDPGGRASSRRWPSSAPTSGCPRPACRVPV